MSESLAFGLDDMRRGEVYSVQSCSSAERSGDAEWVGGKDTQAVLVTPALAIVLVGGPERPEGKEGWEELIASPTTDVPPDLADTL